MESTGSCYITSNEKERSYQYKNDLSHSKDGINTQVNNSEKKMTKTIKIMTISNNKRTKNLIIIKKNSLINFDTYKFVSLDELTDSLLLQLANQKFCAREEPMYNM